MDTTTIETGFILDAIKMAVESEPWQEHFYDDTVEGRGIFLGTVFALLPSGKFYTPWASSNVELCPECHGKGDIPNENYNQLYHDRAKEASNALRVVAMDHFGAWCNGLWSQHIVDTLAMLDSAVTFHAKTLTCPACNGLGSQEAYHDELWYEKANSELESIGLCLENGEGDPCDLFAMEYRDKID